MTDLGPVPATSLQPLRSGDRDPRERQHSPAARKSPSRAVPPRGSDLEAVADSENGAETHELDERA